jgi:hypothetical protein
MTKKAQPQRGFSRWDTLRRSNLDLHKSSFLPPQPCHLDRSVRAFANAQWRDPRIFGLCRCLCLCLCFSFCHSRRESASSFAFAFAFAFALLVIILTLSVAEGEEPASSSRNRGPRRAFVARWGGKRAPVLAFPSLIPSGNPRVNPQTHSTPTFQTTSRWHNHPRQPPTI